MDEFITFVLLIFGQSGETSVHLSISGLCQFLVGRHFLPEGVQHFLHVTVCVPSAERFDFADVDSALTVNAREVNLGHECDCGRSIGVLSAADDRQHVDAVVEIGAWWSDDRAVPVSEGLVVSLVKSVRDGGASSFLGLLELVVQLECSWFYIKHR